MMNRSIPRFSLSSKKKQNGKLIKLYGLIYIMLITHKFKFRTDRIDSDNN